MMGILTKVLSNKMSPDVGYHIFHGLVILFLCYLSYHYRKKTYHCYRNFNVIQAGTIFELRIFTISQADC